MPEYQSPEKKVKVGLPLWVMTFADLMTLLMCFFVLILSFSELDILKYKQLAGSMAHAFGVQRDIEAKEPPKGINIIAREFSPGQPQPTPLNVIRQKTISEMRIHLEVGGYKTQPTSTPRTRDQEPKDEAGRVPEKPAQRPADDQAVERERPGPPSTLEEHLQARQQLERADTLLEDATADEILAAREARERQRKREEDARKILAELQEQIQSGAVDVEREGEKIIIRIREKASFASGSADVVGSFKPVLWRLGEIIEGMEGRIVVAGHTDPVPISTPRFRSNWELSSGRAVSVVHELLWQTAIPLERFLVQGHGETRPVAPNDSPANRARNRRVEIILLQGNDQEAEREITQRGVRRAAAATPPAPAPAVVPQAPEAALGREPPSATDAPAPATGDGATSPAFTPAVPTEPAPAALDAPPFASAPAEVAPSPATGAGAARPSAPPPPGGSGVTAGVVRAPVPPVAPDPEQEMP